MKRRIVLAGGAAALALPCPLLAAPRVIGLLSANTKAVADPGFQQLVEQLARRGWNVGKEIALEVRYGNQQPERLPELARELVALKPAVLVGYNNVAVVALKKETRTVPIVMIASSNPATLGLVASLARPGGNITGTMWNPLEIAGKAVELLKSIAPRLGRVAVVWNPEAPGMSNYKPYADRAAEQLKVALTYVEVRNHEDFRAAAVMATRPEALYVVPDPVTVPLLSQLARLAAENRLPSISFTPSFTDAGGLMALAPDLRELAANVADHVDSILRGVDPAMLPVRVPTHFNLTLNMKTARALGIAVSREFLLQASEVIE